MDVILTNARIHTLDPANAEASCLVVRDGRIAAVGGPEVAEGEHHGVPVRDLQGRTVVPAFIDAHTHPGAVAKSRWHVRLPQTTDVNELLAFMRSYAADHPPEEVPFLYFEYTFSKTFSDVAATKELLDSAVSDRPCFCQDFGEHTHWVNSRMLELMGITRETPDPVPGLQSFDRDQNGEPTGLLREYAHEPFLEQVYDRLGWTPPDSVSAETLAPFLEMLTGYGVAALLDALLEGEDVLAAVRDLERSDRLPFHYEAAVRFTSVDDLGPAIAQAHDFQRRYGSDRIRVATLKLFLDGTNESGNSAVLEPLHDACGAGGSIGAIRMNVDQLRDCLMACQSEGLDLHIHLVGDRAFRVACDAVEQTRGAVEASGESWSVQVTFAHCELVDPADMARPAELGIIVNWTPHWSGGYFGDAARTLMGIERWERMYRFNEIADSGACVTFSSDVVTSYEQHRADPLFGMQVAASRVDTEFPLDPDVYPGSVRPSENARLSRELLLRGYTIDAARQLRIEDRVGSLEVGKLANLVVLSADPMTAELEALASITCHATLVEGAIVFGTLEAT